MKHIIQKLLPWFLLVFFLIAGSSMVRTLWHARSGFSAVSEQEQKILELEQEVESLENAAFEATSSFTLEKRVREELRLQKPDEAVIKVE